jgi:hypothetical protein
MPDHISRGFKAIEESKEARLHTTEYSKLKFLKKVVKYNNKKAGALGKTLPAAPSDDQVQKLLPSQQKRMVRTFKTIEHGDKVGNTEMNRKDVKRLYRFGFIKKYFKNKPGATIETANRLSERENKEHAALSAAEEAAQVERLQSRMRHDRLLAEREEEAHKNARARTHVGVQTDAGSNKSGHSVAQPRVSVADRGAGHGAVTSIFKVVDASRSREVEPPAKPQVAVLPPESHEEGDTDLPMAV